jgi:hypothetical protein
MHRDSLDAKFAAGPLYAQRYFAAIGYDNFIEHRGGRTLATE